MKIGPFRYPSLAEVPLLRRLPMAQFSLLSRLPPLSEIHRVLQDRVNIRCGDRERAGLPWVRVQLMSAINPQLLLVTPSRP